MLGEASIGSLPGGCTQRCARVGRVVASVLYMFLPFWPLLRAPPPPHKSPLPQSLPQTSRDNKPRQSHFQSHKTTLTAFCIDKSDVVLYRNKTCCMWGHWGWLHHCPGIQVRKARNCSLCPQSFATRFGPSFVALASSSAQARTIRKKIMLPSSPSVFKRGVLA